MSLAFSPKELALADEIDALGELALLGFLYLHAFAAMGRHYDVPRLPRALSLVVRFQLGLGLEPDVHVELDEQLRICAVLIDGQAVSPEQWLQLTKADLPMLARPELEEGGAPSTRPAVAG